MPPGLDVRDVYGIINECELKALLGILVVYNQDESTDAGTFQNKWKVSQLF